MKIICFILYLRLREFLGNWRTVIAVVILPLFFIFLIGSAFGKDNIQAKNVNIFVDEDQSVLSGQLLAMIENDPMVEVIQADRPEAFRLLAQMRAQNVFIILPGFGADVAQGKVPLVEKYASKGLHAGTTPYQLMAAAYRLVAVHRTGILVEQDYINSGKIAPGQADVLRQQVVAAAENYWQRDLPFAVRTEVYLYDGPEAQRPTPIGYLGMPTGMILTFMALFLGFGVVFIIHDSESGLLTRISLVAGEKKYLAGNVAAMVLSGTVLTLLITMISQLVFGIIPGCSYPALSLVLVCYGLLLVGGLVFLSLVVGNAPAMYSVAAPMIVFLSFVGGCFFSIEILPALLHRVTFISPQGLAIQAIKDAAQGNYLQLCIVCGIMLLLAMPFFYFTLQKIRRHII